MIAQLYLFDPSSERLSPIDAPASRPLRWAAWHPDGSWCLLAGNGGTALRYDPSAQLRAGGKRFEPVDTHTKHNLRGAAFSPDGQQALLVGNRGALLLSDGASVRPLAAPTSENLRRAAWRPQGDFALIVGNAGTVLRYDPSTALRAGGAITPVPGDRAHTLRALAWRPDGAYALVGAYASRWAGYPRPHALYKCDGLYLQALLTSDDEDDFVAVDWHPNKQLALIAGYAFRDPAQTSAAKKLLIYDGSCFSQRAVKASRAEGESASGGGALLGAAWHPSGDYALLCGEGGALLRFDGKHVEQLASGTKDNLVGPFWRPDGSSALLLRGPGERVYTV